MRIVPLTQTILTQNESKRNTAWHCITLHGTALHCMALHGTALHCMALHCIAWHCIAAIKQIYQTQNITFRKVIPILYPE